MFRFDSLAWGALIAFSEPTIRQWARPTPQRVALISAAAFALVTVAISTGSFSRDGLVTTSIGHTLLAIASAGLIALCVANHPISTALAVPALQAVGRVSYGVYLFHPLTMAVVDSAFQLAGLSLPRLTGAVALDGALQVAIVTAAAVGVAMVSFYWFEQPLMTWKPPVSWWRRPVPTGDA